jgi:subtilisin family serine protease
MKKKFTLLMGGLLLLLISANQVLAQMAERGERPAISLDALPSDAYEKGQISIKFKAGWTQQLQALSGNNNPAFGIPAIDSLVALFGVDRKERLFDLILKDQQFDTRHKVWGFHLWYTLKMPNNIDAIAMVKAFAALKDIVEIAEPSYKKILYDRDNFTPWTPNDTLYSQQWHYNNTGQEGGIVDDDIDLPEAWDIEKGSPNVIVAIMDGGIDTNHLDLRPNLWSGRGYNFVTNSPNISPENHGTHVAGTVAAKSNNITHVAGVAGGDGTAGSGVRLMSCQVFTNSSSGGFATSPIWAADRGAAISQNSWGYTNAGVYEQATLDAYDYFIANGGGTVLKKGLVIFAAGNNTSDGTTNANSHWPGCYDRVIGVVSTNNRDSVSWYTNYGISYDISAPGGETTNSAFTTINGGRKGVLSTVSVASGNLAWNQGTSMACPHVSGVAALAVSKGQGRFSASDIKEILLSQTDNHYPSNAASYAGKLGTGRLNAFATLQKVQSIIAAPMVDSAKNFTASLNVCDINLSWQLNNANNQVMIAVSSDSMRGGYFGLPNGNSYAVGNMIDGKSQVIYKGTGTSFAYTYPTPGRKYYFKIWSIDGSGNYSLGMVNGAGVKTSGGLTSLALNSAATPDCQINMSWTRGCYAGNILVAGNSANTFGAPNNSNVVGAAIAGGGTLLYKGTGNAFAETNIVDSTLRYYRIFDSSGTTQGNLSAYTRANIGSFAATSFSSSQINLAWTRFSPACYSGDVMIATNSVATFGIPTGTYTTGATIAGGGTVIYIGPLNAFQHTGLTTNATYIYRIWPVLSSGVYGFARTANACAQGSIVLPYTDGFNVAGSFSQCFWDTEIATAGSTAPELSIVTTGTNPSASPAQGAAMVKFNSFNATSGASVRLKSKPFASTSLNSLDVAFRWYEDNSAYTTAGYVGEGVRIQYSINGTTWTDVQQFDRIPFSGASGWKWKQVTLPAAVLNQPTVYIGLLFTSKYGNNCYMDSLSIHPTKIKATDGLLVNAKAEFTDAAGWTHYYDSLNNRLISIQKNGNNIGKVGESTFNLYTAGNAGTSTIMPSGTNYVTNAGGWKTFNRYWFVQPTTEPTSNVNVRFYYTQADFAALQTAAGSLATPITLNSHSQMVAYKINDNTTAFNVNPASGHTNVTTATGFNLNGYWEYAHGATPTTTNWTSTSLGSGMFQAEYTVGHFGGGGLGVGGGGAGALPVTWLSFNATASNKQVLLQWRVANEINCQQYDVEYSMDGVNFNELGTVNCLNTLDAKTYQWTHGVPLLGANYYRIRQKDRDGKTNFSKVARVQITSGSSLVVVPNPATQWVSISSSDAMQQINCYSLDGRLLQQHKLTGQQFYQLSVSTWANGTYVLQVVANNSSSTLKLVKQ